MLSGRHAESDAVIIFDRVYYETEERGTSVEQIETVHRKIKINSLFGLEVFNKLYIPTFEDLHYKTELLDCRVKTQKPDNRTINTDLTSLVETTLPANVPFFTRKKDK